MGQWLKSIGGYTVEQIGSRHSYVIVYHALTLGKQQIRWVGRQLSLRHDRLRDRVHARVRDMDGLHARTLACTRVYGHGVYRCVDMYFGVG